MEMKEVTEKLSYMYTSFKLPLMSLRDMVAKSTMYEDDKKLMFTIVSYDDHP